jgi:hypothetical protein
MDCTRTAAGVKSKFATSGNRHLSYIEAAFCVRERIMDDALEWLIVFCLSEPFYA